MLLTEEITCPPRSVFADAPRRQGLEDLSFGKDGRVEILADVLNALNDTAETSLVTRNIFSPNFGVASRFVGPLRAMVGVKLSF